ncbi:ABC transporter ATP-binding protein [Isoptericola sp. NPDC055881]
MSTGPSLRVRGLRKVYPSAPPVVALDGADLDVHPGERLAVLGRSGAGKSTLLNILGLLDTATAGDYDLLGVPVAALSGRRRDTLRADALGFVFQASHVLGHRTVAENVLLKLTTARVPAGRRRDLVDRVLHTVGLSARAHALGATLSGGEKQRLALARAVVTGPRVVLADEPTGNLDDGNAANVLHLLDRQAAADVTVVVITHDPRTARWADRVVELADGRLHRVEGRP